MRGWGKRKACNRLIYRILTNLKNARDEIRTYPDYQLVMIAVRRLLAGVLVENKPEWFGKACRTNLWISR
jgi:hypothetical protein